MIAETTPLLLGGLGNVSQRVGIVAGIVVAVVRIVAGEAVLARVVVEMMVVAGVVVGVVVAVVRLVVVSRVMARAVVGGAVGVVVVVGVAIGAVARVVVVVGVMLESGIVVGGRCSGRGVYFHPAHMFARPFVSEAVYAYAAVARLLSQQSALRAPTRRQQRRCCQHWHVVACAEQQVSMRNQTMASDQFPKPFNLDRSAPGSTRRSDQLI